jgi:cysteine sulfinate desulfinase/cysteine desulfurase-like protein
VLTAIGVSNEMIDKAVRVSLSPSTTEPDIRTFIDTWKKIYNSIKQTTETIKAA